MVPFGSLRERGLRLIDDGAKRIGLVHGEIGEHLAVHLDTGVRQAVDEARVGQIAIMRANGGVDALNPQSAEIALLDPAIAIGVLASLFDGLTRDERIQLEEIFGPVVSMVRAETLDDVIDLVNTRNYANAACIYTASGAAARAFKYRIKPSMIGVNIGIAAPMSFFPFGGAGNSMFGDIKGHGQESFLFYTDMKVVIERWY